MGLGFRIQGLEFRVLGFWFWLGSRVANRYVESCRICVA